MASVKKSALDIALMNMIIIGTQSVAEVFSGYLIDLHAKNYSFLPGFIYGQEDYRAALLLMPWALIAVFLLSLVWLLQNNPDTSC